MRNIIFGLLEKALEDFYAREQRNLELDVHEICHAHRLSIYFEERIRDYDKTHEEKLFEQYYVDVEFNRTEGGMPKMLNYNNELHKKRSDILLHRKGLGDNNKRENILVIELKKEKSKDKVREDICAIKEMVSPGRAGAPDAAVCDTLLGVFLRIGKNAYWGTKYWYEDHEIKEDLF